MKLTQATAVWLLLVAVFRWRRVRLSFPGKSDLGEKTEVLYTYKAGFSSKHSLRPLQIGGMHILPAENVTSLGVTLDSCLTLNKHVSAVCSAASLHIRNIGKTRHLLTQSITEKLVHAFITARLDYCTSILYGLPKRLIQRLQRIQNTAARLVTRTNRDDHITPVLKGLHWLPVQERITYKTIHGSAPSYLSELVSSYTPSRSLRSSSKNLLCRRKTKLLQYGGRSFFQCSAEAVERTPGFSAEVRILRCLQKRREEATFL